MFDLLSYVINCASFFPCHMLRVLSHVYHIFSGECHMFQNFLPHFLEILQISKFQNVPVSYVLVICHMFVLCFSYVSHMFFICLASSSETCFVSDCFTKEVSP